MSFGRSLLWATIACTSSACALVATLDDHREVAAVVEAGPGDAVVADQGLAEDGHRDEASLPGDAAADGDADANTVSCPDGGTPCGAAGCVDLQTSPDHCGACGAPCGVGVCQSGACPARLVFITLAKFTGALNGLSGADAKCQDAASAALLRGKYKAWLSLLGDSPFSRFTRSTKPYKLVTGVMVAQSWGDLVDGTLLAPINESETGAGISFGERVWTNTLASGLPSRPADTSCAGFTATTGTAPNTGVPGLTDAGWTLEALQGCDTMHHLQCFEQP